MHPTSRFVRVFGIAVAVGLAVLAAMPRSLQAQDVEPSPAIEPEAVETLRAIQSAYQALEGYGDQGQVMLVMEEGDRRFEVRFEARTLWIGPETLDLATSSVQLNAESGAMTIRLRGLRQFERIPAPEPIRYEALIRSNTAIETLLAAPDTLPLRILLQLLIDPEGVDPLLLEADALSASGPDTLSLSLVNQPTIRITRDPETGLIARMALGDQEERQTIATSVPGRTLRVVELVWTSGAITTDRLRIADRIRSEQPEGYTPIAKLDEAVDPNRDGPAKRPSPLEALIGQPGPLFSVQELQPDGSLIPVTDADFRERILVLDFWATWCGPCLRELPEIAALIERFEDRDEPVPLTVLAVSLDRGPDAEAVRPLVQDTLAERQLDLIGGPIGRVALDPLGVMGRVFSIQALPSLVLVAPDGTVRHVHVGFDPEIAATLEREINAILNEDEPAFEGR